MDKPEGVYKNVRLMHACTSIVGYTVHLQTTDGTVWEGVFCTFSPEFTVHLQLAIQIDPKLNSKDCLYHALKSGLGVQEKAFFDVKQIVSISALDVDLNYAAKVDLIAKASNSGSSKTLATDADISGFDASKSSINLEGKQLESWQDDDGDNVNTESMLSLDDVANTGNGGKNDSRNSSRGWDAQDMFRYNERVHKVTTTYDEKLTDYTLPLPKHNSKEWRKKQDRAAVIAKEIEGNTKSQSRLAKEDEGDCEEEKFSAVIRPVASSTNLVNTTTPASINTQSQATPPASTTSASRLVSNATKKINPSTESDINLSQSQQQHQQPHHQQQHHHHQTPPQHQQYHQQQPDDGSMRQNTSGPNQPYKPPHQKVFTNNQNGTYKNNRSRMDKRMDSLKAFGKQLNIGSPPPRAHGSMPNQMQSSLNQNQNQQQSHLQSQNKSQQPPPPTLQQRHHGNQSYPAQSHQHQQQAGHHPQHQPSPAPQPPQPTHHYTQHSQQSHQHQPPPPRQQPPPPQHQQPAQHVQNQSQQPAQQPSQQLSQQQRPQPQPQQPLPPPTTQQPSTQTQVPQTQNVETTITQASPPTPASASTVNTSIISERSDANSSLSSSQAKDHQTELARKSKLNPNAKEFKPRSPAVNSGAPTNGGNQAGATTPAGPPIDPNSSPMSQAPQAGPYYQLPMFAAHGLSPHQQQHPHFIHNHTHPQFPNQIHYMSPVSAHFAQPMSQRYVRNNFQNYHHRGEHHNNVRPEYNQSPMMAPTSTGGQQFVPQSAGAPHPINPYPASPQQPMIYSGPPQSMYPIVQPGFQHMTHVMPNPPPYEGSTVYMPPQNYIVNPQ